MQPAKHAAAVLLVTCAEYAAFSAELLQCRSPRSTSPLTPCLQLLLVTGAGYACVCIIACKRCCTCSRPCTERCSAPQHTAPAK